MEIRTIEQTLVYFLIMNPMKDKTEVQRAVAYSYEKEKLIKWYNDELVDERYTDDGHNVYDGGTHTYSKSFKKDGPLEWFNTIDSFDEVSSFGHGIDEGWIVTEELIHLGIDIDAIFLS